MSLDYEITPDPEPDEAAAIVAAIERAVAEDGAFAEPAASAWARAGRDASVRSEPDV